MRLVVLLVILCSCLSCGDPEGPDGILASEVSFDDPELQRCYEQTLLLEPRNILASELEVLRCNFDDVRSLDGIGILSGLLQVEFEENQNLTDINPLTSLKKLDTIRLSGTAVDGGDLVVITQLEELVYLNLSGLSLGDISSLGSLRNLRTLFLSSTNISTGVRELASLSRLRQVNLYNNPLSPCEDIEFLRSQLTLAEVRPELDEVKPGVDCATPSLQARMGKTKAGGE